MYGYEAYSPEKVERMSDKADAAESVIDGIAKAKEALNELGLDDDESEYYIGCLNEILSEAETVLARCNDYLSDAAEWTFEELDSEYERSVL